MTRLFLSSFLLVLSLKIFAQVNCPPSLPLTLVGNTDYCIGTAGSELSVEQNYESYEWIPSGITTQEALLTAGNYWVVVTHYTGCTDTLAFQVQQVSNPPQPTIGASGPIEFCEGESVTLTVDGWYPYYDWNTGSVNDRITVYQSGTYVVSITDWIGCSSSSNLIQVVVNPLPVAAFSPGLNFFEAEFVNHSQNATSYEWNFGDGNFSTDFEPMYTFSASGTVEMWLVAFNDCGSDTAFLDLESVSIEEHNRLAVSKIYPNPSQSIVNVTISSMKPETIHFILLNSVGQSVFESQAMSNVGDASVELDLSHIPSGIYQLRIQSDTAFTSSSFLINR